MHTIACGTSVNALAAQARGEAKDGKTKELSMAQTDLTCAHVSETDGRAILNYTPRRIGPRENYILDFVDLHRRSSGLSRVPRVGDNYG